MRFGKWDYCHFIPSCVGMIIIALFYIPYRSDINNFFSYAEFYGKMTSLRAIFGYVLYISLWIYVLLTLTRIYQHKKQIVNTYSFESVKISLNWLLFITVFYLVYFHYTILHYTILIAIFQINNYRIDYIENPGNPISLLIIYVLSYYGLRQQQLNIEWGGHLLNTHVEKQDHGDNRYTKSGLKENQAEIYLKQLISYMEQSQAWKDLELSVAKLSKQTNIPRHYITQTLNEYLHKNFYTFVNEYRIEYAMELIRSPKYKNWSLLAIAYESGFNSKTAFNNFFKKYTRMTPSEFKKSVNSDPL
ncbi:MAG: helix-turn-helix domain-containing protein [Tannerellaceae bacterium]|jgi:AraC-like DNA-binding protein|nr:helix-turn-helix domain-containing protein [Tannerellaceae bacterium]